MIEHSYHDGGRSQAGYKGDTRDCVVRAIAIGTDKSYQEVYDALYERNVEFAKGYSQAAKRTARSPSPRGGTYRKVYEEYLKSLGWIWVSCMQIGSGCKFHLSKDELPSGNLIIAVSRHVTCVIDGILHDTWDCSREGTRCVYGYYIRPCDKDYSYAGE